MSPATEVSALLAGWLVVKDWRGLFPKLSKSRQLTADEQAYVVDVISRWTERDLSSP